MQAKRENKIHESAVSEVLGAVMLIAVVVTAIAIIGVVLTSQPAPEKIPALDAIISSNGKDTIRIFNNGGDSLTSQQIAVLVDGVDRTSSFTIQGAAWSTWSPGQFLDYNYGALPGNVQLIYKSPSTQTVLVSADFGGGMPTYIPTFAPTPGPAATVSGITPSVGTSGTSVSATISGAGFVNGATAKLTRGASSIPAANLLVISPGAISCTFSLSGATTGSWDVMVTNPSAPPGTLTGGFTVASPGSAPTVTSISPNSAFSGNSILIRNLTGTNFVVGTTPSVKLSRSGNADFFATGVQVLDTRNISCALAIPAGTTAGSWDVTVVNSNGQSGTLPQGFTVYNPGPVITGITPASGTVGTIVSISNLAGTGFDSGTTVLLNGTSFTDIPATSLVVVSSRQITCTFDLSTASAGTRNVVVSNTAGTNMLVNGFVVGGVAPAVYSINPNNGVRGTTVSNVLVSGTGFISGANITLRRSGSPDINATAVLFGSATSLTGTFVIPPTATLGQYDVIVSNPDGKYGTLPASSGFTVNSPLPQPTVSGITPSSGTSGTIVPITSLQGSNFQSGARIFLNSTSGATNITVLGVTFVSSTQLTGVADLTGAPAGQWNVVVINPDGQLASLSNGFTITSPAPAITGITPVYGLRGTVVNPVSIGGSGFVSGATIKLNRTGYSDIPATGITVGSSNLITCSISIPAGTTFGLWNIAVTNPDGSNGMLADGFTVTLPAPTITARSNATMNRGWLGYELITGTNFVSGATSVINTTAGSSVASTTCTYVSATQVFCSYNLLGATVNTQYRVAVINPDGQSAIMNPPTSNYISVASPAPTIPSSPVFSPNTGGRGTTGLSITAPGTNLQPGMAVVLTSANTPTTTITSYNVNVASPTSVTFTIDIPAGATTGAYTARYTNTDGGTVTRTSRFTVT